MIRGVEHDERTPHVRVVVISAFVLERGRLLARQAGADALLPKPCAPSRMLAEVRRLLSMPAA